jgi:hypothetical protein
MAVLPSVERAVIDERKLTDYLLNPEHPQGGAGKAGFLFRFKFDRARPDELRSALLLHAHQNDISRSRAMPFGNIFEIDGPLACPDGRTPMVLVVWIIRTREDFPRLVTAVPSERLMI